MAYDKEKALEALILRVIRQVLAEQAQAKRRLYVVFADAFDCRCVQFLQSLTTADDVTVIVDDTQGERIRRDIELACHFAAVVMTSQARSLPLGGSLTVYPVASRDFIVKAALGMADTFAAEWLARCFAAGSAVHLQLSGLTRFTGREPAAYVQQIRLERAERLLLTTPKSIEEIAENVGYHNKGYFYKIFQEKYGMTPSRYRKQA